MNSRYRGPIPAFNVASLAYSPDRTSRSKRSIGEQQRQHGSGRCAAGTIHSARGTVNFQP